MLMSTISSLKISISIRVRRKLMLMPRLSSPAHKLLMLMFMLMLASQVRTGLYCSSLNFLPRASSKIILNYFFRCFLMKAVEIKCKN